MVDLLNAGAFGEVVMAEQSKRIYESKAFCTNPGCVEHYKRSYPGKLPKYISQVGVFKDAKKTAIDCPDCGCALVWRPTKYETFVFKQ